MQESQPIDKDIYRTEQKLRSTMPDMSSFIKNNPMAKKTPCPSRHELMLDSMRRTEILLDSYSRKHLLTK